MQGRSQRPGSRQTHPLQRRQRSEAGPLLRAWATWNGSAALAVILTGSDRIVTARASLAPSTVRHDGMCPWRWISAKTIPHAPVWGRTAYSRRLAGSQHARCGEQDLALAAAGRAGVSLSLFLPGSKVEPQPLSIVAGLVRTRVRDTDPQPAARCLFVHPSHRSRSGRRHGSGGV